MEKIEQQTQYEEWYSSAEIKNISELGDLLRQIKSRLESEGVCIEKEREKLKKAQ